MKRRDFLVSGVSAMAVGAAGPSGISHIVVPNGRNMTAGQMGQFLTQLDAAMDKIAHDPGGGRFLNDLRERMPAERDAALFRQGMRTLLLVGNFGDLPLAGQVHPGVQKRLRYSAPEMDSAIFGVMDRVKSMTATKRAEIKSALNREPDLAESVIEAIDLEAASVGVPTRRRLQLRAMSKHIVRRLKQSSDLLVDEYVIKCEKLKARPVTPLETHQMMETRLGEAAFKLRLQEAETAARRWQGMSLDDNAIGYRLLNQDDDEKSDRWYRTGLRILGLGAASTAVGWLLIGVSGEDGPLLWPGVVLGVTVGPIAIVVGLVTLLIGAIIDTGDGP